MIGKPYSRPEPQTAVPWGSPVLAQSRGMDGGRGRYPDDAACRDHADLFLTLQGGRAQRARDDRCREICGACPVLAECTAVARTEWFHGFLAGFTELERAQRWGIAGPGAGTHVWEAAARFRRWSAPELEPHGRFCARRLSYAIPSHTCATDGCRCGLEQTFGYTEGSHKSEPPTASTAEGSADHLSRRVTA